MRRRHLRKRRVGELKAPKKRHPVAAQEIREKGWRPYLLADSTSVYWDGFTVVDAAGQSYPLDSPATREELISMILAGDFGEIHHFDGSTWTQEHSGVEHPLNWEWFLDLAGSATRTFAVGSDGMILGKREGG